MRIGAGIVGRRLHFPRRATPESAAALLLTFLLAVTISPACAAPQFQAAYDSYFIGGLAIADLNQDGHLDLISGTSGANVAVQLGKGDGTFGAAAKYLRESQPGGLDHHR